MLKVNNRNTRKRFDLRSIKKPERSHLRHLPLPGFSIADNKQVSVCFGQLE